ncbi:MAG TPA: hypothetical protein VKB38_22740 [Terracidiphilus sp.]|nr:hypothetical protein [Terracidiphilus sp.]
MTRWLLVILLICAPAAAQQVSIPVADEISGRPYAIQKKWVIGGIGNWGYLALDPVARQLFITHQTSVQVVDIESGAVAGEISGFEDVHAVVLDPSGPYGYTSDGRADQVKVFDRRSLRIEATINLPCAPHSIALEPANKLLFAVCAPIVRTTAPPTQSPIELSRQSSARQAAGRRPATRIPHPQETVSQVALIDTDHPSLLGIVEIPGELRFADADDDGHVYITASAHRIVRFEAARFASEARDDLASQRQTAAQSKVGAGPPATLAWNDQSETFGRSVAFKYLPDSCSSPRGLAIDNHGHRLFVACDNQQVLVLNSLSGGTVASLTVGPGSDSVAYDPDRNLIFTANGGGYGSLSVIRQHQTDSYAVIQNLPTMERARTMAIDPSSGLVYLVTDLHGVKLDHPPANGIGTLKLDPIEGSFQVLVVGN